MSKRDDDGDVPPITQGQLDACKRLYERLMQRGDDISVEAAGAVLKLLEQNSHLERSRMRVARELIVERKRVSVIGEALARSTLSLEKARDGFGNIVDDMLSKVKIVRSDEPDDDDDDAPAAPDHAAAAPA